MLQIEGANESMCRNLDDDEKFGVSMKQKHNTCYWIGISCT